MLNNKHDVTGEDYLSHVECNTNLIHNRHYSGYPVYVNENAIDLTMPTIFFVYGSLKKGHKHHYLLEGAKFLGKVETEPDYLLYDTGPYPGLKEVKIGDGRAIEGELYEVQPAQMLKLDKIAPVQFSKKKVNIKGKKNKIITYIWDFSVEKFMDCGSSWPII